MVEANSTKGNWGRLLVNANNPFKKINIIRMLWTVRHLWTSGACFIFNFYPHHSSLVMRNGYGTSNIIHSREGVTQGDLLAMGDFFRTFLIPELLFNETLRNRNVERSLTGLIISYNYSIILGFKENSDLTTHSFHKFFFV